ncbi:hypothetical protein [Amphritea japonica]|uniref:Uncharacterized protein n=1 Tax=Amphritea japonica ATCC BAA-1530 TaxID=1278309 RepID=A0A7R6PGV7_9GAMM|nr:hypothetical protein [Amphritea japonica]BBB26247.1 hypothetical protein AMJAP_1652 [Amphritea japonica ATCC BAA-1530]
MKKAILVMAALVAFSVSGLSNAASEYDAYKDWVQGDPDYWAKGGKTKRVAVQMKKGTGDLVDLRTLGRGGVPGALFAAGTYGASLIWKDELKELEEKSLFELFMGDNAPADVLIDDGTYVEGRYWYHSNSGKTGPTLSSICGVTERVANGRCETLSWGNWINPGYSHQYFCSGQPAPSGCSQTTQELFGVDPSAINLKDGRIVPLDTSLTFPYNNGLSVFTNDEGETVIITAEPNSLGGIDITNERTTENAEGEEVIQQSKLVLDADGMIVNVSTGPVTPTVNIANPVNVNLEFPDDYARENTLQEIRDTLNTVPEIPAPNHAPVIDEIKKVEDSIKDTEPLLPSLPSLPVAFGGSESCSGIRIIVPFGSIYTFDETFDKHCDIARDIINPFCTWLFGVLTAFLLLDGL